MALPTPDKSELVAIPGMVPDLIKPPPGCRFSNRCEYKGTGCSVERPPLEETRPGHLVACHRPVADHSAAAQG
jgi:oligopeptide/dipeptide ABC transporter ATP-binding protein